MADAQPQKYPYFGVPPARQPRPAANEPALMGKRVVLSTPEGFVHDMRAASEVLLGIGDSPLVEIVTEADWFAGARGGVAWPVHLVWVE